MPDTQNLETPPAPSEQGNESETALTSTYRRAAAVEAAYILEAVRK